MQPPRRSASVLVVLVLVAGCAPQHGLPDDVAGDGALVDAAAPTTLTPLTTPDACAPADLADGGPGPGLGSDAGTARALEYKSALLCGDSQVGYGHGLTRALEQRFRDAGVTKYHWDAFTSASVQGYDESDRLPKLIAHRNPDVVLITIGSNNVQNPHPEGLAGNIRSIAKKAKAGNPGRDCFILGPPLPIKGVTKDTGIIRVLAENSAPCKFFDTSRLALERQKDRIHPNDAGGEVWAEALWNFMLTGTPPP